MYDWFTGNKEEFDFTEVTLGGDECVLVTPRPEKAVGAPWYEEDKAYRSSIWRKADGFPVSLGFKKFVNFGEIPYFEPVDPMRSDYVAVEKVDGSCLICSRYNGEYIFRTRGTTDATKLPNGKEIPMLVEKYGVKALLDELGEGHTILFEWVTPTNVLCVHYSEADLYLTGIIRHGNYSYFTQSDLDAFAEAHGLKRPRTYHSLGNATELSKEILDWVNQEGVVAYFGENNQILKKMKSNWHHHMHVARTLVGTPKRMFEFLDTKGAFTGEDAGTKEKINNIVGTNLEWEVLVYYEKVFEDCVAAYAEYADMVNTARELTRGCTEYKEILALIEKHPEMNQAFFWNAWRGKDVSHTVFKNVMLAAFERSWRGKLFGNSVEVED